MSAPPQRLAVRVTPDAMRHIRRGHPWVFDGSITSVSGDGRAGDLAVVFDDRRRFAAVGLYDPDSPVRIKLLAHGDPVPVDDELWRARIDEAHRRRGELAAAEHTDAYRVVHGENDALPGLVLDRYGSVVVCKVYSNAWFAHLDDVLDATSQVLEPSAVVLRRARRVTADGPADGSVVRGRLPEGPVRIREHGLRFDVDVVRGQKTGHFLDQRDNRLRLRRLTSGARVLDVFSCTGGFTLNAAAGGAESVHSVDLNPAAIDAVRHNLGLNRGSHQVRACRHHHSVGDAREVMEAMARSGRRFDVVVVDPPSFASAAAQVPRALRAYGRLTEAAVDLLEPGGLLVQASCSSRVSAADFHDEVARAVRRNGRVLDEHVRTEQPVDHPVGFAEGAYLKAVFGTVHPA